MEKYFHDEKFEFLVVKTFDIGCYGFNLKCADQSATAKKIIQDVNSFIYLKDLTDVCCMLYVVWLYVVYRKFWIVDHVCITANNCKCQ